MFLHKFTRRFDIGFRWFNSKAGMEHEPLATIGLVASELIPLLYLMAIAGNSFNENEMGSTLGAAWHPYRISFPASHSPAK